MKQSVPRLPKDSMKQNPAGSLWTVVVAHRVVQMTKRRWRVDSMVRPCGVWAYHACVLVGLARVVDDPPDSLTAPSNNKAGIIMYSSIMLIRALEVRTASCSTKPRPDTQQSSKFR